MAIYHPGPAEIEEGRTRDHEDFLEELAFALETKVAPEAALEMAMELEMIRELPPSQRAAAKFRMGEHFFAFVTAARKEKGGNLAAPNLKDAAATSGAPKVDTTTSAVENPTARRRCPGSGEGGRC